MTEYAPHNAAHGVIKPKMMAVVDEQRCIGCTLCIQVCPVDAILGAQKQMHTVISQECTGCELCVAPCPVDCIEMVEIKQDIHKYYRYVKTEITHQECEKRKADVARQRHEFRLQRLEREKAERAVRHEQKKAALANLQQH